jgi:SAM-dependent methyltransferase
VDAAPVECSVTSESLRIVDAAFAGSLKHPYDEVPYPGFACPETNPAHLEVIGRIFGTTPAAASSCNVLEVGSGDGTNLLSLAQSLPNSHFVGVDVWEEGVLRARRVANWCRLDNVEFRQGRLEDLDSGQFDYVIAHGVYSWVEPRVSDALLKLFQRVLTPKGLAFVSYNVYPGSYLRQMAGEICRYHVRSVRAPEARIKACHELMQAVLRADLRAPYSRILRQEFESLMTAAEVQRGLGLKDVALLHETLASSNRPVYFHEFMAKAEECGLQFVSEARLDSPAGSTLSLLDELSNTDGGRLAREQYRDFAFNSAFRQTVLCHASTFVADMPNVNELSPSFVSAQLEERDERGTFSTPAGVAVRAPGDAAQAILRLLAAQWPEAVAFEVLESEVRAHKAGPGGGARAGLANFLLDAWSRDVVNVQSTAPPARRCRAERPVASPLARAQCVAGSAVVSSLLHRSALLEGSIERRLLPLLDGRHDRGQLGSTTGHTQEAIDTALHSMSERGLMLV